MRLLNFEKFEKVVTVTVSKLANESIQDVESKLRLKFPELVGKSLNTFTDTGDNQCVFIFRETGDKNNLRKTQILLD